MTYLSLGEAAKAAGIAKGTISKALKSGRLSYASKSTAGYQIDPAELFRVFPINPVNSVSSERLATSKDTPIDTIEMAVLRTRLEAANQRAEDLARQLDQANTEKSKLLTLLTPSSSVSPSPKGLFSRLFGR